MKQEAEQEAERTCISMLETKTGTRIRAEGWIHRIKKLKHVTFMILRDRTGYVQCVLDPVRFSEMPALESVVAVIGTVEARHNAYGEFELNVDELTVLSEAMTELPIVINQPELGVSLDTQLKHRVLSLRHASNALTFQIQSEMAYAFRAFLRENQFTEIHTPKLVKEGAEGGADVFSLDYFGQKAYLAQSPQFYKQMMVIAGLERVYEIGPVFRAEPHSTRRHLNEYTSMDLEMGFIEDIEVLMTLETELLKRMMTHLKSVFGERVETSLPQVPERIPRMTLEEAVSLYAESVDRPVDRSDLDPEGERFIGAYAWEKWHSDFLFLTHYPAKKRPMYTMPSGENSTESFDLLFRGLEITTGGLRIHDYDRLVENMKRKGLDPGAYSTYLEAFKFGAPPHGGLAIGLERLTAQFLGLENIREATLFPRDASRLLP